MLTAEGRLLPDVAASALLITLPLVMLMLPWLCRRFKGLQVFHRRLHYHALLVDVDPWPSCMVIQDYLTRNIIQLVGRLV
jgi:hypothetical protein